MVQPLELMKKKGQSKKAWTFQAFLFWTIFLDVLYFVRFIALQVLAISHTDPNLICVKTKKPNVHSFEGIVHCRFIALQMLPYPEAVREPPRL
ncbi:hypothetical protein ABE28_003505 [Peribacillus muralis]|uniref:Uncharacterized protein n=1 Tax=Peribacillus muralis TaxID=264697 RepID=A0A1B3XJK9_9BACI|nr:hypothetical protein ABE28_003505 [Peribacillus muralis]